MYVRLNESIKYFSIPLPAQNGDVNTLYFRRIIMLSKRLLAGAFKLVMVGVKEDSKASDNGCYACQCVC